MNYAPREMDLPDPESVTTAHTFRAFVGDLRASLELALATPVISPWDDLRAGWTNWTLASYVDGMARWIAAAGRLPLDRDGESIWDALIPTEGIWDGGEDELRQYLVAIEAWAGSAAERGDLQPWHDAAQAMRIAVGYE